MCVLHGTTGEVPRAVYDDREHDKMKPFVAVDMPTENNPLERQIKPVSSRSGQTNTRFRWLISEVRCWWR